MFLQTPRTKVFLCVFNVLNRLTAQSIVIAKAVSSFPHLIDNLAYQLNYIDSQLTAGLAQTSNRHVGHVRSSESARSINEIIGNAESNLNTLEADGVNQNPRTYQQAQIVKELMEILLNIIQKADPCLLERSNLSRIIQKVSTTCEQHNLVILQQLAQNILAHSRSSQQPGNNRVNRGAPGQSHP